MEPPYLKRNQQRNAIGHIGRYQLLGAFGEMQEANIILVLSACPSVLSSAQTGCISIKHDIWVFLEKSVKKIQVSLTHCGRGHLNCLNARYRGLNNLNQLLYCVSLNIYNKFANYEGWNFNSGNYLFTTDTK